MNATDALTSGPRGRRMLLAYAMGVEVVPQTEFSGDSFGHAVTLVSYHLESGKEGARVMFGPGAEEARQTVLQAFRRRSH